MPDLPVTALGDRICILGPSNSGKSTLAAAIGRARDLPVVHLDQLRHIAGTQWQMRPDDEFAALHDEAVATDRWVMDGKYTRLMPQRLERATGLILLDASTVASVGRYLRRTFGSEARVGGLDGTRDRFSWGMLRWIVGPTRADRQHSRALFDELGLPKVSLPSRRALERYYEQEHLTRF